MKTGTCLHVNQGLAQKRNFNPKSKQEKYQRKFKSMVDHGKIYAKWPRAPPLSQLENLATLWDTVKTRIIEIHGPYLSAKMKYTACFRVLLARDKHLEWRNNLLRISLLNSVILESRGSKAFEQNHVKVG